MTKTSSFLEPKLCRLKTLLFKYKPVLLTVLITGLLCYMYAFTNKLPNHDDVYMMFTKGVSLESGRWGLELISLVLPDYSMPWIYGLVSLLFVAIAICYIIKLFEIKNMLLQVALTAVIVSFPSLTSAFSYMFFSSAYTMAFMLTVISVYFIVKRGILRSVISILLLACVSGIYQGFVSMASGLIVVYLVRLLVSKKIELKAIILEALRCAVIMALSLCLYFGITFMIFAVTGTGYGHYARNSISALNESFLTRLYNVYAMFIREFLHSQNGLVNGLLCKSFNIGVAAFVTVSGLIFLFGKNKAYKKILLVFAAVLYPLAVNSLYLITQPKGVHTLVVFSFISVYVLAAVFAEDILPENFSYKSAFKDVLIVLLSAIALKNAFYANEAALRMQLSFQNTYSFYTSIASEIQNNPRFKKGMKVAVIGKENENFYDYGEFSNIEDIKGIQCMYAGMYSKEDFFKYYIGLDIDFASAKVAKRLSKREAVRKMPAYPYYGSIKKIGNYMVVKLEDM